MATKRAIVTAYTGEGWYEQGQQRLLESLGGVSADVLAFNESDLFDSPYYDKHCPYTIKAAAIKAAAEDGYNQIIWMDCSVQVINPLDDWFKLIERDGYYFMAGGWNCAQECNDRSLEYFGFNRDHAELLHSLWSCIFALDLRNEKAKDVFDMFLKASLDGIFHGSRHHDGQSADPRFQHHRQDQSVLSLAFHKIGLETFHPPQIHMWYAGMGEQKETNLFKVQGGI